MLLFYLFPTLDVSFLLLAVPTYLFLFHMFKTARTHRPSTSFHKPTITATTPGTKTQTATGWWRAFRESTFYTAVLLISAFIVMVIVPDLVILFVPVEKMSTHLRVVCALLCRETSFVIDASIYILTISKVKKRMKRVFCRLGCCGVRDDELVASLRSRSKSTKSTKSTLSDC